MAFISTNIESYIKEYDDTDNVEAMQNTIDQDIEMQLLDIDYYHTTSTSDLQTFTIMLFGKTENNQSVFVQVKHFCPYFFVEVQSGWRNETITQIIDDIKKKVPEKNRDGLLSTTLVKKHKFYGFTNDADYNFIQLTFGNFDSMRSYSNVFLRKHYFPYLSHGKAVKFNVYESNINPIIRFLHIQNIDPIGWIKISKDKLIPLTSLDRQGSVDINVACDWADVQPLQKTDLHKFIILSFDIECTSEDGKFPTSRPGDKVIQIGMTYSYLGESECFKKIIICLNETSVLPDVDVYWYNDEKDVLLKFSEILCETDPDIIVGYNIFGFDWNYLHMRAQFYGIESKFARLSRILDYVCPFEEKELKSSALGNNILRFYNMPGRISIDIMKVIQRDYKLPSYKLDSVSSNFIRDKIVSTEKIIQDDQIYTKLHVKSTFGIYVSDFISIFYNDGYTDNSIGHKHKIVNLEENKSILIQGEWNLKEYFDNKWKVVWCQAKDDVEPKDIFRLFAQDPDSRAIIAKYCIQDCVLCNRLIAKLQILPNSIAMGNVCCVPLSYLFLRGQGVKIFSLVAKQCRIENYLIPTLKKKKETDKNKTEDKFKNFVNSFINIDTESEEEDEKYEGATVYDPIKGVHYSPIIVGDFGSLYPSCIIEGNFSHDSYVIDKAFFNPNTHTLREQTYNNPDGTTTTCPFALRKDGKKAIIPRILIGLLSKRDECKQLLAVEKDPFKRSILDGRQLSYKITANSVYGQCGAPTSPIYLKVIAACTTALGRERLGVARTFVEIHLPVIIRHCTDQNAQELKKYMDEFYKDVSEDRLVKKNKGSDTFLYKGKDEYYQYIQKEIYNILHEYDVTTQCIYGDTDSVFFKLIMTHKITKAIFNNHDALKASIKLGPVVIGIVNNTFAYPQVWNYEKVYWPFAIISKKRYVGNLYEFDPDNFYQKSMGLVTKRRDNADIVKVVVGGIIDQILNKRDMKGAIEFTKATLKNIIMGKYSIDKFVITKTLKDKEDYADWTRIVHAVLADRMAQRDPGNKPLSNDRIPYVYVETNHKCKLQGERVDTPKYVIENNLKIDYLFYITNQIMKPATQFLELIAKNPNAIFKMYIMREENRRAGIDPIMKYISNTSSTDRENIPAVSLGEDLFGPKTTKQKQKRK